MTWQVRADSIKYDGVPFRAPKVSDTMIEKLQDCGTDGSFRRFFADRPPHERQKTSRGGDLRFGRRRSEYKRLRLDHQYSYALWKLRKSTDKPLWEKGPFNFLNKL